MSEKMSHNEAPLEHSASGEAKEEQPERFEETIQSMDASIAAMEKDIGEFCAVDPE